MRKRLAVALALLCCLIVAADPAETPQQRGPINFEYFWSYFLVGVLGAASLELLKLYEYRGELTAAKYKRLIRSPVFWGIVAGMLAASGFFAWAINSQAPTATALQIAMAGAAMRSAIRQGAGAVAANQRVKFGDKDESQISFRDIF